VDEIEVSTVVYVPPGEAFEFLMDFPGYTAFTQYLEEVHVDGDGGPGTQYDFVLSWWRLSYTANSEVTDVEQDERIDWRLVGSLDAEGCWELEPAPEELDDDAPEDADAATRITFRAQYRLDSVKSAPIDPPAFVSMDTVIEKVKPVVLDELGTIVGTIVEELEGEPRAVEVHVSTGSTAASGDGSAA
jgi:uncharacterized membrane protein